MAEKRKVYIIGHKNPDTDSICSAISYAYLRNQLEPGKYAPMRAGQLNAETEYVLKRFQVDVPKYISDVSTQVKDIEIRKTKGVNRNISLKKAWGLMKELNVVTLPITSSSNRLEGLITTEDIAKSYMDVYDSKILATAHTKYSNIVETLDGEMIFGNLTEYYTHGKVLIAAANPDMMENFIEEGDLVILGNRYESQLCAIEMNAGCIVVCDGATVSKTILKLAESKNCYVITSPHDTYTVARLINQSMPVNYFMKRENIVLFQTEDLLDNVRETMSKMRHRDFPILDKHGSYKGMISRRNLLNAKKKQMILVDHNEKTQAVDGVAQSEILEIIDHHRLGALETVSPVYFRNEPLGCTATIVYKMFDEKHVEIPPVIAGLLLSAIISDTLMYRSPTCTVVDRLVAEKLAEIAQVNVEELAKEMFHAGSLLKDKSPEEVFYQDFKKFNINDVSFGIGQINSMDADELTVIKDKLALYLEKAYTEHNVQAMYFMLTNILTETTELMYMGEKAPELIKEAYHIEPVKDSFILKGVVSRKKQLLPSIMQAIQS